MRRYVAGEMMFPCARCDTRCRGDSDGTLCGKGIPLAHLVLGLSTPLLMVSQSSAPEAASGISR